MGRSARRTLNLTCSPSEAEEIVLRAMRRCDLKIKSVDQGIIRASRRSSIWSFGQNIVAMIHPRPGTPETVAVDIESSQKWMQLVDYGTNEDALSQIERQVSSLMSQRATIER